MNSIYSIGIHYRKCPWRLWKSGHPRNRFLIAPMTVSRKFRNTDRWEINKRPDWLYWFLEMGHYTEAFSIRGCKQKCGERFSVRGFGFM